MNKKTLFLSAVVTFALLLSGCKFGEAASTNVSTPSSKTETSSSSSNGSSPFNSSPTASSTPTTSVVSSSSSTPVSSSSSAPSSSSIPISSPSAKDTPSFGDAFKQNGATLTLRGIITLVKANGFYMADDTGFAYVDREQKNEIQLRHKNLASSSSEIVQGAYVEVTGQISTEKRSLVIVPANDANVQILSNEKPSFTLPAAQEMTAIELKNLMFDRYIQWISSSGDMGGSQPFPVVPYPITCSELLAFPAYPDGRCLALGPGLAPLDFEAEFDDDGLAFEKAPYQITFYLLDYSNTSCSLQVLKAEKLTPDFPYTTIADLKKNPIRGAHYNVQAVIVGSEYSTYVVDDGTGRILIDDARLGGTYGTSYEPIGSTISFKGTLAQDFSSPHYELTVYSRSQEITHVPTPNYEAQNDSSFEADFALANDSSDNPAPFWVSVRFSCTLTYRSGGSSDDPIIRCKHGEKSCIIQNYKAVGGGMTQGDEFIFTGYMIYGNYAVQMAELIYSAYRPL